MFATFEFICLFLHNQHIKFSLIWKVYNHISCLNVCQISHESIHIWLRYSHTKSLKSLKQFCGEQFLDTYYTELVFCVAPLCLKHCLYPLGMLSIKFWHTCGSIFSHSTSTHSHNSWIPFGGSSYSLILPELPFNMIPKVFDGVKLRRLSRPLHNSETMVFEPGLGLLACVFGVIILAVPQDSLHITLAKVATSFEHPLKRVCLGKGWGLGGCQSHLLVICNIFWKRHLLCAQRVLGLQ